MLRKTVNKLKQILQIKPVAFIRYNYLNKAVERKKGCYIIPYRYSCIKIVHGAKVVLDGNLYVNRYRIPGSKESCYVIVSKDAKMHIKGDVTLRYRSIVQINPGGIAEFGHFTSNVGINIQCEKHITIGDDCMLGRNVVIYDSAYHPTGNMGGELKVSSEPVVIGNHVWLGTNVVVRQGTHIGNGSIIGTNSYVCENIEPNTMVSATPSHPVMSGAVWARSPEDSKNAEKYFYIQDIVESQEKQYPDFFIVKEKIEKVLGKYIKGIAYQKETELIGKGLIDSLALLTVVNAISEEFSIEIPYQEVNAINFNSVKKMSLLVCRMMEGTSKENNHSVKVQEKEHIQCEKKLELDVNDTKYTVVERIFRNADKNPNQIAIIAEEQEISYLELTQDIYNLALYLQELGIKKEECIVVQGIHSEACIALYYAIHLIGAVLVPAEKKIPKARLCEIAEETKAVFVVSMEIEENRDWISYEMIRHRLQNKVSYRMEDIMFPSIDAPCEMIFTTGTTGKSKGVLMTHANISWYAYAIAKAVEMKEHNRFLITTPLNHAGGIRRTHLSLANGCCVVYLDGMSDLGKYFNTIEKYRVTALYLPPVAIRILIARTGNALMQYQNQIDFVYSSSSSLPSSDSEKMRELLPKSRLYNAYEASETPGVSVYDYNEKEIKKNCIGFANTGVHVAILNANGELCQKQNEVGNICVKSPMNMKEYYQEKTLTSEVMMDGWFVSNDLGYLDADGGLYYSGRSGDVINIGGYKIAPTEVEDVALQSKMIQECICIEEKDSYHVSYLKLLVVPEDKKDWKAGKLLSYMEEYLEPYKLPRVIEEQESIKKTFNGKLDRKAYRK